MEACSASNEAVSPINLTFMCRAVHLSTYDKRAERVVRLKLSGRMRNESVQKVTRRVEAPRTWESLVNKSPSALMAIGIWLHKRGTRSQHNTKTVRSHVSRTGENVSNIISMAHQDIKQSRMLYITAEMYLFDLMCQVLSLKSSLSLMACESLNGFRRLPAFPATRRASLVISRHILHALRVVLS